MDRAPLCVGGRQDPEGALDNAMDDRGCFGASRDRSCGSSEPGSSPECPFPEGYRDRPGGDQGGPQPIKTVWSWQTPEDPNEEVAVHLTFGDDSVILTSVFCLKLPQLCDEALMRGANPAAHLQTAGKAVPRRPRVIEDDNRGIRKPAPMSAKPQDPAGRALPPNAVPGTSERPENIWVTGSLSAGQSEPRRPRMRRNVDMVTRDGREGRENNGATPQRD